MTLDLTWIGLLRLFTSSVVGDAVVLVRSRKRFEAAAD
jgi:hypothetical protein